MRERRRARGGERGKSKDGRRERAGAVDSQMHAWTRDVSGVWRDVERQRA